MPLTLGMLPGRLRRPVYIGKGSRVATSGAAAPTYHADTGVGDRVLLVCQTDQNDTVSTPSGWTSELNLNNGEFRLRIFSRAYDSGSSVSITWSGDHIICRVLTFRGVSAGAPIDDIETGNNTATGQVVSIPGCTTIGPNRLALAMVAHDIPSNGSCVSGWSNGNLTEGEEIDDICTTVGWDGGFAIYMGYKAAAGNIGTTTASLSTARRRAYASLALAPA